MYQRTSFLAALVVSAGMAPAFAATTTYTTPASFLAAVAPGSFTNTFTGVPDAAASYSYSQGGFGYTVTAGVSDVYLSGSIIGNNLPDETLTVTFTSGNVTAVGGNFYISDAADLLQIAPVTLTLSDGTTTSFSPTDLSTSFRGYVSTSVITSLVMSVPPSSRFNTIDNLTVGVGVVPEASTWALMALGMAGIAFARRQRFS